VNLALFVPGFPARESDWFVPCVSGLVHDLSRHHRVDVFALKYPRDRLCYRWRGLSVAAFGHPSRILPGPLRLHAAVAAAREAHCREGYDGVAALWGDETALAAALFARRERLPLLLKLSAGEAVSLPRAKFGGRRSPWQRFCLAQGVRQATVLAVGSKTQCRDLLRLGLRGAPAPILLPFGVDTELFRPGPPEDRRHGGPSLLAVGSLVRVKGFDLLLKALSRLLPKHPGLRLRVVGDGVERANLTQQAAGLGLEGRVSWEGWIEHRLMPGVYRQADLLVSPSLHEAQGMACLEALACGLPVVGTDTGMLPELLAGHAAGRICPTGSVGALTRELERMLVNRERWPAMGADGRTAVLEQAAAGGVLDAWRDAVEYRMFGNE